MRTAHAVAYTDNRSGHFRPLDIDEMKEIPGMVKPAGCENRSALTHCSKTEVGSVARIRSFPNESSLIIPLSP